MILKLVGEIRKAFSPFDWSIFLVTYLLAIAAATLLWAVAIAAAIARATVVRLRLVVQATAGIATSELGPSMPCTYPNAQTHLQPSSKHMPETRSLKESELLIIGSSNITGELYMMSSEGRHPYKKKGYVYRLVEPSQ